MPSLEEILSFTGSAFFFLGITALTIGDYSQTSLKTVSLLALGVLVNVPLDGEIGDIFWYCIFGVLWAYLFYQIVFQKESWIQKTYRKDIDNFPHWLCCLLPSLAATFCTYLLVEKGQGLSGCRAHYSSAVLHCTHLFLWLLSANINALAFLPQGYIILYQVWGYEGGTLSWKTRIAMTSFFICFSIWTAMFATEHNDMLFDWSGGQPKVYGFFILAQAVTLATIAAPWIYRATCLKCCGSCTPSRSGRKEEQLTNSDTAIVVNTGMDNNTDTTTDSKDKNKSQATTTSTSWWGGSKQTDEGPAVHQGEIEAPEVVGGSFGVNPLSLSSNSGSPYIQSTTAPATTYNNNNYDTGGDMETPDWLQT